MIYFDKIKLANTHTCTPYDQQTKSQSNTPAREYVREYVSVSKNDIECYAYDFGKVSAQFELLAQAMDLLRQHKDDLAAHEVLCELIQLACCSMTDSAHTSQKDLKQLLKNADRIQQPA